MTQIHVEHIDFAKLDGLVPAVVQHWLTGRVLMLGFMNPRAFEQTQADGRITFYSRTRQRLWQKGETSGHVLELVDQQLDCDNDTLLLLAKPHGPVCHTGADTCFQGLAPVASLLFDLEATIRQRKEHPVAGSHTSEMFARGLGRIAQKLGEEATEVVIESLTGTPEKLSEETADLLYRLLCLLVARDLPLEQVLAVLDKRKK
jgi:phosphoribosyl-ATP pyrophosphohydrolase/phosphoribosyl-AMP cyclohydrolase